MELLSATDIIRPEISILSLGCSHTEEQFKLANVFRNSVLKCTVLVTIVTEKTTTMLTYR